MGQLRLVGSDNLRQQQPLALLAYLSLNGAKTRRHLATVFWPEAKQPLNNLSSALTRIRHRLPDAVVAESQTIAASIATDVADLHDAIERADAPEIVRLYEGHFFERADVRAMGLELEEWIFSTREALACAASSALLTAAENIACHDPTRSSNYARHAYEIGRTFWFSDDLWQRCHDLLVQDHSVIAERVRIEASELGHDIVVVASPATSAPAPFRTDVDDLVGRSSELATLYSFVQESSDTWLTITGIAGIGKTALARTFARELRQVDPTRAVRWIALADLREAERLPAAIASGLGIACANRSDLAPGLRSMCSLERPMTLVLDGADNVENYEMILQEIVGIRGLTVIVTSQAVTGHRHEQSLPLEWRLWWVH